MQINCSSKCYLMLMFAFLFYFTNHKALSFIFALMFLLFIFRSQESFMNLEPIQDNHVPQIPDKKKNNKVRSYVPYTISPYLEVPYTNGNIKPNDTSGLMNQEVDAKFPPTDMNIFFNNEAKPEYCEQGNAMFSTDLGCIKLRPDQIRQLSSRGHNMDPNHSYI
jgi:hypothetical protein